MGIEKLLNLWLAIKDMFEQPFTMSKMVCIVENMFMIGSGSL